MSDYKTVEEIKREYGLDDLEVHNRGLYIDCGRGMDTEEFNRLGQDIKRLQEHLVKSETDEI